MQTFLPYPDFQRSAACLDSRRLGKQRLEAFQILRTLQDPERRGYEDALRQYMNCAIEEWARRGFRNTMELAPTPESPPMPWWLGDAAFHASHRANLLRKDPAFYGRYGWSEPSDLPYVWPVTAQVPDPTRHH